MTGNRRVKVGAIVKIDSSELLNGDNCVAIGVSHVYGVVIHQEEYDEESSLSDYTMNWAINHLPLCDYEDTISLFMGIDETLLEVVKYKEDDDGCVDYPLRDFFKRKDGC